MQGFRIPAVQIPMMELQSIPLRAFKKREKRCEMSVNEYEQQKKNQQTIKEETKPNVCVNK